MVFWGPPWWFFNIQGPPQVIGIRSRNSLGHIVRFLKGVCSREMGNWGTLRIPREDLVLGNILED